MTLLSQKFAIHIKTIVVWLKLYIDQPSIFIKATHFEPYPRETADCNECPAIYKNRMLFCHRRLRPILQMYSDGKESKSEIQRDGRDFFNPNNSIGAALWDILERKRVCERLSVRLLEEKKWWAGWLMFRVEEEILGCREWAAIFVCWHMYLVHFSHSDTKQAVRLEMKKRKELFT